MEPSREIVASNRVATGLVALLALLAPGPSRAEEVSILLSDGDLVRGEILAVDDESIRLIPTGATEAVSIPVDRIDPVHVYSLREPLVGDDVSARLRLADWCIAHDLPSLAAREYRRIAELDPSALGLVREGLAAADESAAEALYQEAAELGSCGEREAERQALERLLATHASSRTALLARAELALLDRAADRRAERARRAEERRQAEIRRRAGLLDEYLGREAARAAAIRDEAAASAKFARGHRLLLDSVDAFETLIPYANELAKYDPARADGWRAKIRSDLVDVYNMLTVVELERQNSRQAQHWISQTLLLDPDNERAKELRDINVTYGIEEDPYRMPIGELTRRVVRGSVSAEMVRAFVNRTGPDGLRFLQSLGVPQR